MSFRRERYEFVGSVGEKSESSISTGVSTAAERMPTRRGHSVKPQGLTGTIVSSAESNWQLRWVYDGEVVRCPWHGLEFHVPTGQCLAYREIRLRSYEVIVQDGTVSVII